MNKVVVFKKWDSETWILSLVLKVGGEREKESREKPKREDTRKKSLIKPRKKSKYSYQCNTLNEEMDLNYSMSSIQQAISVSWYYDVGILDVAKRWS